jgi:hypothetical protein
MLRYFLPPVYFVRAVLKALGYLTSQFTRITSIPTDLSPRIPVHYRFIDELWKRCPRKRARFHADAMYNIGRKIGRPRPEESSVYGALDSSLKKHITH